MDRKFALLLGSLLMPVLAAAQDATSEKYVGTSKEALPYPQIINVSARAPMSLDGWWKIIPDQYESGYYNYRLVPFATKQTYFADLSFSEDRSRLVEYDFDMADSLMVPGDWNTQKEKFYYYEGTIWYRKKFDYSPKQGRRVFLYFGGANYETIVGVNGRKIGKHTGGFTPFNFEITGIVKDGENSVIAKVDNRRRPEGVPTINTDWWNYGGITRNVYIIETPETFIRDYAVQLKKGTDNVISGWVQLDGGQPAQDIVIEIADLRRKHKVKTDENGFATFEFKAAPELWSPENPRLYEVSVSCETDSIKDSIGFRTVEVSGAKILINGKETYLKGVSIHEEKPFSPSGRACGEQDAELILGWAKEMGCNFVRLAHYPHNEAMVRTAERMGIMVWSEIPVYWTIHWTDPGTYSNARNQLEEMITRDKNRANVIIWSVANETPRNPERLDFLKRLISRAKEMDGTRLVAAAMEKTYLDKTTVTVNDELIPYSDVVSFNEYLGWYDGMPDKCRTVKWTFDFEKPVIITEFGAGAKSGLHGDRNERFTEEHQAWLYEEQIKMFSTIPGLSGTTPWILKDFRSPKRPLRGIQDDFNRKGLVSSDGQKKAAFYVMKSWYGSMDD